MFLLREAQESDFSSLCELAKLLNSVNLPGDPAELREVLNRSLASFACTISKADSEYLFVLEEEATGRIVGTSMIFAQHGSKDAPHIFLRVDKKQHYASSVDKHFKHTTLSVGYDYEGPTEIGGLVLHPSFRGHSLRLGLQLSFLRFVFIAMKPEWFRDCILAELLPPFTPEGRSPLWEAFGRRFTGLDYWDADRISRTNKEFVKDLFPAGRIYASLLDEEAQAVIGEVGDKTRPVRKMLERIGFRYSNRVDPFDGGPHYEAAVTDVQPIQDSRAMRVVVSNENSKSREHGLVVVTRPKGTGFELRGACIPALVNNDDLAISPADAQRLGVVPDDDVFFLSL